MNNVRSDKVNLSLYIVIISFQPYNSLMRMHEGEYALIYIYLLSMHDESLLNYAIISGVLYELCIEFYRQNQYPTLTFFIPFVSNKVIFYTSLIHIIDYQ
jgi:hypothetical protein